MRSYNPLAKVNALLIGFKGGECFISTISVLAWVGIGFPPTDAFDVVALMCHMRWEICSQFSSSKD